MKIAAERGGAAMGSEHTRRKLVLAAALAAALVVTGVALAEAPVVLFDPADQAAAKAAVLRASDLGPGWKGGLTKAEVDGADGCPGFKPKQADLVVTGLAESEFKHRPGALTITSQAQVLKTKAMVRLDWERTVAHPSVLGCMRRAFADTGDRSIRFVSANRISFPRIGSRSARYRVVMNYAVGEDTVPMLFDFVAVEAGRTELSLSLIAPLKDRRAADTAEARLARILVQRATT
jgi:hypothetical protein